jgi:UDP-N-acetylmuramoyl-tripeptide--D-alanyl-D-alanine ligase
MKFGIPVIGVTGSNGKTTSKDMIYEVLSPRFKVLKNEGTKNNHLGVPQTLLKLDDTHEVCVLEMGMNHKGEIRALSDIARPNIAIITNVGLSHLKFLKNLEGVFEAKREITEFLKKGGLLLVNGDDKYLSALKAGPFKIKRFGFDDKNSFQASLLSASLEQVGFLLNGKERFRLNVLGTHNVYNALAAIAVARHFDIGYGSIRKSLARYKPADMRLNIRQVGGIVVIDDAYNSNPLSMQSALQAMKVVPATSKWIVSADMLELGSGEKDFHKMIGESVAGYGFDGLLTFGRLSRYTHDRALECGMPRDNIRHCSSRAEIADMLRRKVGRGGAVLVKGSRAMKMEEVVQKLKG